MATIQTPPVPTQRRENPSGATAKRMLFRLAMTAAALALWFWTQSLIGARSHPDSGIGDWTHAVTSGANQYLFAHPAAANALLIVSSGIIDLMGIFLLGRWLIAGEARPLIGLVLVLGLRQIMQACVALPAPPNEIWHYPGFPSLLVTCGVANDYFFSGHTAIAALAASEMAAFRRGWLTVIGVLLVVFEIVAVLVLRAHYAMDVFTGLITGLYAAHLSEKATKANWLKF